MRKFLIKPGGEHGYINLKLAIPHPEADVRPTPAMRGEIMLNVQERSGKVYPLPFYHNEIEEVKP